MSATEVREAFCAEVLTDLCDEWRLTDPTGAPSPATTARRGCGTSA